MRTVWKSSEQKRSKPSRGDLLVAVALAVTASLAAGLSDAPPPVAVAAVVVAGGAGLAARSLPLAAAAATLLVGAVAAPWGGLAPLAPAQAVLCLLLGRRTNEVRRPLWTFVAFGACTTLGVAVHRPDTLNWVGLPAIAVTLSLFPWLIGRTRRQQQELVAAGWTRAEQLEREREIVEREARLRERADIAAEMHDSLGHELALLALRAAGLEVAPGLGDAHRAAAADLRSNAARATARLGEIVGLLRDVRSDAVADMLEALVGRAERAGVAIATDLSGEAELAAAGTEVRGAVHRVVQEGVTNAARHAPGAPLRVSVTTSAADDAFVVLVENGPPDLPSPAAGLSVGTGLAALAVRVESCGGRLQAGPVDAGFRLAAAIPRHGRSMQPSRRDAPDAALPTSAAFAGARRSARRSLALTLAVPAGTALVALGGVGAFWAYEMSTTVLDGDEFRAIGPGDPEEGVVEALPSRSVTWGAAAAQPPLPADARCKYFRSGSHPLRAEPLYRICFRDGRVVLTDTLPVPDRAP